MLCPLKRNSDTTKDLTSNSYYKLDEMRSYFGKCDESECALWYEQNNCCSMNTKSVRNIEAIIKQ